MAVSGTDFKITAWDPLCFFEPDRQQGVWMARVSRGAKPVAAHSVALETPPHLKERDEIANQVLPPDQRYGTVIGWREGDQNGMLFFNDSVDKAGLSKDGQLFVFAGLYGVAKVDLMTGKGRWIWTLEAGEFANYESLDFGDSSIAACKTISADRHDFIVRLDLDREEVQRIDLTKTLGGDRLSVRNVAIRPDGSVDFQYADDVHTLSAAGDIVRVAHIPEVAEDGSPAQLVYGNVNERAYVSWQGLDDVMYVQAEGASAPARFMVRAQYEAIQIKNATMLVALRNGEVSRIDPAGNDERVYTGPIDQHVASGATRSRLWVQRLGWHITLVAFDGTTETREFSWQVPKAAEIPVRFEQVEEP